MVAETTKGRKNAAIQFIAGTAKATQGKSMSVTLASACQRFSELPICLPVLKRVSSM